MKDYIVLDIESPNKHRNSVSAIGIVIVKDNMKVSTVYSLINPEDEFEEDIIDLTGITPEMVEDSPKFNEYWPEIKELLINYSIVGHNITYDLTVISRTLERYDIKAPDFEYYCTLQLTKKRLKLKSYSLTNIMHDLGVEYNAHNALADAEATLKLFKYLDNIKKITILDQKKFSNHNKKELAENLIPNINELYGYALEMMYKDEINENQIAILRNWVNINRKYENCADINNILNKLNFILDKEIILKGDISHITKSSVFISKSEYYSKEELNLQIFGGILKMLRSDNFINTNEYEFVDKWLHYYELPSNIDINEILSSFTIE